MHEFETRMNREAAIEEQES